MWLSVSRVLGSWFRYGALNSLGSALRALPHSQKPWATTATRKARQIASPASEDTISSELHIFDPGTGCNRNSNASGFGPRPAPSILLIHCCADTPLRPLSSVLPSLFISTYTHNTRHTRELVLLLRQSTRHRLGHIQRSDKSSVPAINRHKKKGGADTKPPCSPAVSLTCRELVMRTTCSTTPPPRALTTDPVAGCISNRRYFGTAAWK